MVLLLFFAFVLSIFTTSCPVAASVIRDEPGTENHQLIPLLAWANANGSAGDKAASYYISPHTAKWLDAKRECESSGMKLLAIKSPAIQSQVEFELNHLNVRNQYVYTSGNDQGQEGTPVWWDNSRFLYENDYCTHNNIRDDCMVLHASSEWKWHFLNCDEKHRFICQV